MVGIKTTGISLIKNHLWWFESSVVSTIAVNMNIIIWIFGTISAVIIIIIIIIQEVSTSICQFQTSCKWELPSISWRSVRTQARETAFLTHEYLGYNDDPFRARSHHWTGKYFQCSYKSVEESQDFNNTQITNKMGFSWFFHTKSSNFADDLPLSNVFFVFFYRPATQELGGIHHLFP